MIDLRSDTVTRPSAEMRAAIAAAPVGDDVYADDPTMNALEERVADLFGKEAGVFAPTGSLTNQLGIRTLVRPGEELLTETFAHIVRAELGAGAVFSGITTRTWEGDHGLLKAEDALAIARPDSGPYLVSTTAIAVENTHNFGGGTIQPIDQIGELCRSKGIIFHSDAAQATGKTPIDLEKTKVDLVTFTAHKTYGPKGIGAVYVRRKPRVRIEAQMHGGGHERGMRSGTLATHQIVGMGECFRIAREEMASENERIRMLRDRLWNGLNQIEEVYLNGDMDHRIPHNLNISFNYVEGESMMMALKDLAISSGSACTSASLEPSYVLKALGLGDDLAHSSLRFGLSRFTTEEEIDYTIKAITDTVLKLREMSPLWEMYKEGIDLNTIEWTGH
mgnify:CR=1 FL=1